MIAVWASDHARGGLSEGSANVAVFSLNPEDMTTYGNSILSDNPRNAQPQQRFKFLGIENIGFPHDERITHDGRFRSRVRFKFFRCCRTGELHSLGHAHEIKRNT